MEPMLLEEYDSERPPQTVQNLLDYFEREEMILDENDILVGLLYILMLESGFITPGDQTYGNDSFEFNYRRVVALSKELPKGWKKGKNYELFFVLPMLPLHVCQMICITTYDDLVVNCSIRSIEDAKFSMALDAKIYVPNTRHLYNLRGLSTLFKSKMCYSVKCSILSLSDFRFNHMCLLPWEVLVKIASYLKNPEDLLRFGLVCQHTGEVVDVQKLEKEIRDEKRREHILARIRFSRRRLTSMESRLECHCSNPYCTSITPDCDCDYYPF